MYQEVEVIDDHPFHSTDIANDPGLSVKKKRGEATTVAADLRVEVTTAAQGNLTGKKGSSKKAA